MATRARQAEADKTAVAFQVALTQLGVETALDALDLWQDVPPLRQSPVTRTWLTRIVRLVLFRRRQSRELARSYYRLSRALQTGSTIQDPSKPGETETTLTELRSEFAERTRELIELAQEARSTAPGSTSTPEPTEAVEDPLDGFEEEDEDELERILIEEIEQLREDEKRIEAEAERELQEVLEALGPANLDRKLDQLDLDAPATDVDRLRDDAHARAGARQASASARIAMNGARSTVWSYASKDKRVVGYVRLSRTGTPCGWCAMLISRGAVYKSDQSAEYADGDKYHDNCHCYAMPVYSREQYAESDLFALNRKYQELWPQVTKGLSGKSAVSAWRRFIRQEQKAQRAQAARSTTNVQEA